MAKEGRKRGRPRKRRKARRDFRVVVLVTYAQKRLWSREAAQAGVSLSAWVGEAATSRADVLDAAREE